MLCCASAAMKSRPVFVGRGTQSAHSSWRNMCCLHCSWLAKPSLGFSSWPRSPGFAVFRRKRNSLLSPWNRVWGDRSPSTASQPRGEFSSVNPKGETGALVCTWVPQAQGVTPCVSCHCCSGLSWYEFGSSILNQLLKLCSCSLPLRLLSAQGGASVSKEALKEVCYEFSGPPGCALACVPCGEGDALAVGSWVVCMCCSSWLENTHHPMAQLPAFVYPNWIKAFKLLYLGELCRFSSHMHTLSSLVWAGAFVLPFPASLEHLAGCDGVIMSQAVESCVPWSCLFFRMDNFPPRPDRWEKSNYLTSLEQLDVWRPEWNPH